MAFRMYYYQKSIRGNGQYGYILYTNTWEDQPSLCVFLVPTNWNDPELVQ